MKKYFRYSIVGLLFLFISLLITAPASLVAGIASGQKGVSLFGVQGSAWSGSVQIVTVNSEKFENVRWDLSLFSLFIGQVSADVSFDYLGKKFHGEVSVDGFGSGDVSLHGFKTGMLKVDDLFSLINRLGKEKNRNNKVISFDGVGSFAIDMDSFSIANPSQWQSGSDVIIPTQLSGVIDIKGLGMAYSNFSPVFGDFQIKGANDNGAVKISINSGTGKKQPFILDLNVKLFKNGEINIQGRADYNESLNETVRGLVKSCFKNKGKELEISGNINKKNRPALMNKLQKTFIGCLMM
ncbi:MAG: type II secretion system protein N [Gammaproteobacteria bacterium]|nr:MAG: type II secretion system protein N [Gammaproteobacteria bacterium]